VFLYINIISSILNRGTALKRIILSLLIFINLLLLNNNIAFAQVLAGTDDLGRTLLQNDAVGNPKHDKYVAIFYHLNHGDRTAEDYWDLSKIIPNHPEVLNDYDSPYWGKPVYSRDEKCPEYYWGKPIYGYYRADDYWVIRRNVQLFTDVGIDLIIIDVTKDSLYADRAKLLMKAIDEIRAQGMNPPKIAFYTHYDSGVRMEEVYEAFYKEGGMYYNPKDWFYLPNSWYPNGQPLIIGIVPEAVGHECELYFTWRESQYPTEKYKTNGWPLMDFNRPQRVHFNYSGEKEVINVSAAQNPDLTAGMGGSAFYGNKDNRGRSYHNGKSGNPETDSPYGYNFQEQWDVAIKENPKFVFVTGWNTWTEVRKKSKDGNLNHSYFCDEASPEYSNDIEPTLTGNLKDNYYMQLVNNIRKFKGAEANPLPGKMKTIHNFNDWESVTPVYKDYTGDAQPRNWRGAQSKPIVIYKNYTGRNDFDILKVARSKDNVYFYAQTVSNITPNSDDNWMRLYINVDRKFSTGWKGYDFRIVEGNRLQKYSGGKWEDVEKVEYSVKGNKMMITLPRKYIPEFFKTLNFEFKWSDNMQDSNDPLDWYVNGDAAPGGRFNWLYSEK
jgi:hypothetical protein